MSPRHPSWPRRQRRRATPCRARIPAPLLPGVIAFFLTRHHSTNTLQRAPDVTPGPPALPRARDAGRAHSQHASGVLGPGPKPRRASQERALQGPGSFGPALGLGQCDSDISLRLSIASLGSGLQKNPLWPLGHGGHTRPPSARSARPSRCAELSPAPPPAGPEALDPPDTPPPAPHQPGTRCCPPARESRLHLPPPLRAKDGQVPRRLGTAAGACGSCANANEDPGRRRRPHAVLREKRTAPGSPRLGAGAVKTPGGPGAAPCGHDRASGGPRLFQAEQRLSVHKGEEKMQAWSGLAGGGEAAPGPACVRTAGTGRGTVPGRSARALVAVLQEAGDARQLSKGHCEGKPGPRRGRGAAASVRPRTHSAARSAA